jgi:hypothetical protein
MSHIDYPNNNNPDNFGAPNYSSQSAFDSELDKGDRGYYGNDNGGIYPNSNSVMALYVAGVNLTAGNHSAPGLSPVEWLDVTDSATWAPNGLNPPANWREVTPTYDPTINYAMADFIQHREARRTTLALIKDKDGNLRGTLLKNKPPNSNLKV